MSAPGAKCFVSGTLFETPSNTLAPVERLDVGSRVLSADGESLQVMHRQQHKADHYLRLVTGSAVNEFTGTHRIMTPSGPTYAERLAEGDIILTKSMEGEIVQQPLVSKEAYQEPCDVYELFFYPDKPVASCQVPTGMVLSMGQSSCSQTLGNRPSGRRTRRPGQNLRDQRAWERQQQLRWPATESSFSN
jgi:hypothetical protein